MALAASGSSASPSVASCCSTPGPDAETSSVTAHRAEPEQALAKLDVTSNAPPRTPRRWPRSRPSLPPTAFTVEDTSYFGKAEALLDRVRRLTPAPSTASRRGLLDLSLHHSPSPWTSAHGPTPSTPSQPTPSPSRRRDRRARSLRPGGRHAAGAARPPARPAAYCRASYLRELHGDDTGALEAMREAAPPAPALVRPARSTCSVATSRSTTATSQPPTATYERALRLSPDVGSAEFGLHGLAARASHDRAIARLIGLTRISELPAAFTLARRSPDVHRQDRGRGALARARAAGVPRRGGL